MQVNLKILVFPDKEFSGIFSNVFKDLFIQCQAFKALLNG